MEFSPKANILVVDDHVENLLALEAVLIGLEQNLVRATSGAEALRCLLNQDFAVILLDVQMPDLDGFETATLIRQRPRSACTPIIFLTAFNTNDSLIFKGYSLGAVDYLFKPIDPVILTSKVSVFVDLFNKTAEIQRQATQLAAMNAELRRAESVRKQFLREQAARQQAEAANRMKDEFLAIVSHELRTPLNSIMGWSRLLLMKTFDPETTTRALEIIERNATAQAQLIADILDVSQIMRGKLRLSIQTVDLISLVHLVLDMLSPLADAKSIEIELNLDSMAQYVSGDPERLRQVVWNLLSNAIKFTPDAGKIEIQLTRLERAELISAEQLHTDSSPIPVAQLQIRDSGIGISPDFLPHVFDRFRQADSTLSRCYGGLGLGLAIAQHLVKLHQGEISAESEGTGKGSTFTVHLPLSSLVQRPDEESELPLTSEQDLQLLQELEVLLVEDNLDTSDFVTTILQDAGATVTAVVSAQEAWLEFERNPPQLLISDIGLPQEDGYQLIRKIRDYEAGQRTPAIALTAYARREDQIQALTAGFDLHLPKPIDPHFLLKAVVQLLGKPDEADSIGEYSRSIA